MTYQGDSILNSNGIIVRIDIILKEKFSIYEILINSSLFKKNYGKLHTDTNSIIYFTFFSMKYNITTGIFKNWKPGYANIEV